MQSKKLYNSFLETGEIKDIMPNSEGVWEKDKKEFKIIFDSLNVAVNKIEIIITTDENEFEEDN